MAVFARQVDIIEGIVKIRSALTLKCERKVLQVQFLPFAQPLKPAFHTEREGFDEQI